MSSTPSMPTRVPAPRPVSRRLINGTLIDTVRRNLGVTVEQYADICGIPHKSMKRICAGKNVPNGEHLLRIIQLGSVNPRLLELDGWRRTT